MGSEMAKGRRCHEQRVHFEVSKSVPGFVLLLRVISLNGAPGLQKPTRPRPTLHACSGGRPRTETGTRAWTFSCLLVPVGQQAVKSGGGGGHVTLFLFDDILALC